MGSLYPIPVPYRSPLETKLAKKTTRAITDYFAGTGRTADDLFRDGARLVLHLRDATG